MGTNWRYETQNNVDDDEDTVVLDRTYRLVSRAEKDRRKGAPHKQGRGVGARKQLGFRGGSWARGSK